MKLIDKDKVEDILRNLWKEDDSHNPEHCICYNKALQEVQCEIDTLDAKEVDIRSEVSNWWNNHYASCYAGIKKDYTFEGYAGHYLDNSTIANLAQYFYELGLKIKGVK